MNGSLGISIYFSKRKEKYAHAFFPGKREEMSLHFPLNSQHM
jgi:hypothetical protein